MNSNKFTFGIIGNFLAFAAFVLWPNASHGFFPQDFPAYKMVFLTTGDVHLLGHPRDVKVRGSGNGAHKSYSLNFSHEGKLLSANYALDGFWKYEYEGANLLEAKITSQKANEDENYTSIAASHKNSQGEPDIYVSKSFASNGSWSSSNLNSMITIKRQKNMVTYGEYILMDDKPVPGNRFVFLYQEDKFLKSWSIDHDDPISKKMKIIYTQNYHIVNSVVTQVDTAGESIDKPAFIQKFDQFEFDACKNWTKRMVHHTDVALKETEDYLEIREISYHTPCE